MSYSSLPIIDMSPICFGNADPQGVAQSIAHACTEFGFFYVIGHGVSEILQKQIHEQSAVFFAQDVAIKQKIAMSKAGRAWRGFFPVGGELTSGKPDIKEGIYFGEELPATHPLVKAGTPLHGSNLFPDDPKEFQVTVTRYMEEMVQLSHAIMRGIALSLGLEQNFFYERYMRDPLILFRIFNYPAPQSQSADEWGVGEHTDYGMLTVLKQDENGGLEVKTKHSWIAAPPVPNSFVCNIGDMLDRMTGGMYKSTPHRVRNASGRSRLSFPFFFDPNFFSKVELLPIVQPKSVIDDSNERWDRANPHAFDGIYGDYLLSKVGKVFPDLKASVLR